MAGLGRERRLLPTDQMSEMPDLAAAYVGRDDVGQRPIPDFRPTLKTLRWQPFNRTFAAGEELYAGRTYSPRTNQPLHSNYG